MHSLKIKRENFIVSKLFQLGELGELVNFQLGQLVNSVVMVSLVLINMWLGCRNWSKPHITLVYCGLNQRNKCHVNNSVTCSPKSQHYCQQHWSTWSKPWSASLVSPHQNVAEVHKAGLSGHTLC